MADESSSGTGRAGARPVIPNKLFFRIGEVSQLIGLEPYVLRFWETEFPVVAPKKSAGGQRMFRRKDVETLFEIKHLLHDRKFTLEGARRALQQRSQSDVLRKITARQPSEAEGPLPQIRRELADILKLLG